MKFNKRHVQSHWNAKEKKQRAGWWHFDKVKLEIVATFVLKLSPHLVAWVELKCHQEEYSYCWGASLWACTNPVAMWRLMAAHRDSSKELLLYIYNIVDYWTEVSQQRRRYMWRQTQKSQAHFGDPQQLVYYAVCAATIRTLHQLLFLS